MMPQFDIFSFFPQLFWVFLGISSLYLLFCFSLLPALATILKIRKRKLANNASTKELAGFKTSKFLGTVNNLFSNFNNKPTEKNNALGVYLDETLPKNIDSLSNSVNLYSFSYETTQKYKQRILKNVQNISILQN